MNYDLSDLVDYEFGLIRLIIEFLFGSIIELNGNTEALNFRLVCKKFKQEIDRRAHLSIIVPIRKRRIRKNYRLPSEISSISMSTKYECYEITERDWKDVFGDELSILESSVRYLHVSTNLINYLPKFTCLNSILWEVVICSCCSLLKEIPHKELKITRCHPLTPYYSSITYLTRLSEIEFTMGSSFDHKLVDKYLPSTVLRITIIMDSYEVDVIDLSKFSSLKCLKIVAKFNGQLIEELILPTSLNELYSEVKIEKMNLHKCKDLGVLELKFK
jgi:hypothetical protein